MATSTIARSTDQRVVLPNISWTTYECLVADRVDSSSPRLTYDRGTLEIMSPGLDHEESNRTLAFLVRVTAAEMGIRVRDVGSMTYKRAASERGLEPDSSFYVEPSPIVDPQRDVDADTDPPPNLAIEIDMSRSSIPKLELSADLKVLEVWVWDHGQAQFFSLQESAYVPIERSQHISALTPAIVTRFVTFSRQLDSVAWYQAVLEWVRSQ